MTTGWHVGAVDDFSGDGKAEVLWFNDNGQVQMWNMNGAAHTTTNVGSIGAGWSIKDSADFNGDGKADILLQKGGQVAMWQMDGGTICKSTTFARSATTSISRVQAISTETAAPTSFGTMTRTDKS